MKLGDVEVEHVAEYGNFEWCVKLQIPNEFPKDYAGLQNVRNLFLPELADVRVEYSTVSTVIFDNPRSMAAASRLHGRGGSAVLKSKKYLTSHFPSLEEISEKQYRLQGLVDEAAGKVKTTDVCLKVLELNKKKAEVTGKGEGAVGKVNIT